MFNIRRARQEDCQAIIGVHGAAVRGIDTELYTAEELEAWAIPKKLAAYEEAIRVKEFFVAEDDGVILGFGVLNKERSEVEAVYVSPAAGGRGIGLKVLQVLEEQAHDLGLSELTLNASLNAVPFYERAGYAGDKESKYRLATGVEIPCRPMAKVIARKADAG